VVVYDVYDDVREGYD